jgi:phosphate transport system permease protein
MILALSRAIGETAPLITIGAVTFITFAPDSLWAPFTVLPIQIFNWVSRPQAEFHANAAAAILVLLGLLLTLNAVAIWLRDRYQKKTRPA